MPETCPKIPVGAPVLTEMTTLEDKVEVTEMPRRRFKKHVHFSVS